MSRLPSSKSLPPTRNYAPKRMNPVKGLRPSESCNFCQHSAKSTGSQTIDVNDEYFLKDAIIRFPRPTTREKASSLKSTHPLNEHSTQTDSVHPIDLETKMIDLTLRHNHREAVSPQEDVDVDETLVGENRRVKRESTRQHRIGEVPKYLVQRKKELAHAQTMVNEAPVGHYLLTEEERLEALQLAQARYDQLIQQLNALSITSQTFRTRTKKIDIEKELQSLENTLKIFSRNKVFVNLGE